MKRITAISLVVLALSPVAAGVQSNQLGLPWMLWYRRPAVEWVEALASS